MAFISVTRLRLRSWRFLPRFFVLALRATRQIQGAAGFLDGRLLPDRRLTFWTLTAWDSAADMRAYIMAGDHRIAMPKLIDWCDEASTVHWDQDGAVLPDWPAAEARMRRDGRASVVRNPSLRHADLSFAPARTTASAPIRRRGA